MRYELSLTGGTFAPAVEDFDRKLLLLLDMMRSRGLDEGDVTLKISVEMVQAHPMDEDGVVHDLLCPVFEYETAYRTAQKDKSTGRIGADLVLRVTDGGATGKRIRSSTWWREVKSDVYLHDQRARRGAGLGVPYAGPQ